MASFRYIAELDVRLKFLKSMRTLSSRIVETGPYIGNSETKTLPCNKGQSLSTCCGLYFALSILCLTEVD